MTEAVLDKSGERADLGCRAQSRTGFSRHHGYLRGHLDAVARMVEQNVGRAEALRQMRAMRRTAEKLEMYCLMPCTDVGLECVPPGTAHAITDLYRKANR